MTTEEETLLVNQSRDVRWYAVNVADAGREGDWKRMAEELEHLKKIVDLLLHMLQKGV